MILLSMQKLFAKNKLKHKTTILSMDNVQHITAFQRQNTQQTTMNSECRAKWFHYNGQNKLKLNSGRLLHCN